MNLRAASASMRMLVYIAGPYTKPDPCENTHRAIAVANEIVDVCVPLIPHLSHFWHTMTPQPYAFWTEMDFAYLRRCDALLRFSGESPSIPVFYDVSDLRAWLEGA